ncbi:hypothetical protein RRU01S_29_01110 [Agrobacterium rubi TR3 = NBRC 13261]|uniref:Bacterial OB-fold domain-containing protein n=1 Tax=Agrobacterium rubi TR3 = NBRC 13261 TaxID=1368415 RepID=A0A081D248_9HYPH|nr:hypothetical protein [Agrobacterium rubi]MBP1881021.1 uncharacterized protein YdeI (BOF family) [Agrobacterium rubi]MCL6653738.1 hypothetical protein [Agrobacterium rubi]GAK72994.1 hypothetical protein RRU01S_29_01110 [Agrobacterium rubi TR3 = NBRC 13261]
MQIEDHSHPHPDQNTTAGSPPPKPRSRLVWPALVTVVALAVGVAGGAAATKLVRPTPEMAPVTPVAISTVPATGLVTIKGTVAEIYGNKFILQDESGRALVETGPAGEDGDLVAKNEAVTVQGRADDGVVHASYLIRQDGQAESIGPQGGPPHLRHPDGMDHPKPRP